MDLSMKKRLLSHEKNTGGGEPIMKLPKLENHSLDDSPGKHHVLLSFSIISK